MRDVDLVCRYGGEEFAIILPTTPKNGALTAAEKMRARVARARFTGGSKQPLGKVTVSIGVATVPTDARSADDLIVRVDEVDGGFENGVEIIHVEASPGQRKTWNGTARIVRVDEVDGGFENGVEIIHVEGVDIFRFQSFLTELIKKGKRARASKRKAG